MLKMTPFSPAQPRRAETRFSSSVVLSRPSLCNVPQGYASVAELPAALLECHFEHPAGIILLSCGIKNKEEGLCDEQSFLRQLATRRP